MVFRDPLNDLGLCAMKHNEPGRAADISVAAILKRYLNNVKKNNRSYVLH